MAYPIVVLIGEGGIPRCGRCGEMLPDLEDNPPANYCPNCGARLDQSRLKRPPVVEWV
jgi:rubredoxin